MEEYEIRFPHNTQIYTDLGKRVLTFAITRILNGNEEWFTEQEVRAGIGHNRGIHTLLHGLAEDRSARINARPRLLLIQGPKNIPKFKASPSAMELFVFEKEEEAA